MAAQAFCALQWTLETMVMIFADYEPNWHCNIEKTFDDFLSMKHGFESCRSTGSVCSMDGGSGVSTVSKVGVPQSVFFIACLIGIFGQLSDSSLGGKGVVRLVCNAILGFLTAFSPVYLILCLLTGISTGGVGLSSFVLATKPVGPSKRGRVGMSTFLVAGDSRFDSFGLVFSQKWLTLV